MRGLPIALALCCAAWVHAGEKVTFSGLIDVAAVFNSNRPSSHENFIPGTGTSAKRANGLMLNLAQVQWTRATSAEQPLGFTLSLVAGEGTEVVHGSDAFHHLYHASLAYRLPSGVLLEAGVYPSHIGMEGFYSKDNWSYTRSWLGEFSPYYQTGVKAGYAFNGRWSGQVHVLNGWQIIRDLDDDQAFGTQLAYANGPLSASLNTYADPHRKFADVVMLYRATPRVQLGASIDAGAENGANWQGTGAYARYAFNDRHAVAARAEQFRDPEAAISGAPQTLREATLTYEHRPHEHVILKCEARYDRSTARVFADDEPAQFLALAGAVVTF